MMCMRPTISTVMVRGFPIGARGKWHRRNYVVLWRIGLSKPRAKRLADILSRRALLQTIDLCSMSMRMIGVAVR